MIDWHSHVLPQMDDGSKSVEESLKLLKMFSAQGVNTVIATPHFYANDESLEKFLERRRESYERLSEALPEDAPKILLGAEVCYYPGVSRLEGLSKLCIEGTHLLLLEMPFEKWTEHTLKEVKELAMQGRLTVILAHIERYIDEQGERVFEELQNYGVLMQVNSSFFNRSATKRKALKLLANGGIQLIGSDTHNVSLRPPTLDTAYNTIEKKFGKELIYEINGYGHFLLDKNINN